VSLLCHEIRNPLNGVAGSLEQICYELEQIFGQQKQQPQQPQPQPPQPPIITAVASAAADKAKGVIEWCNTAAHSCSYVIEILDNVLDQSKLEQGKLILDSQPVDLHSLCSSVMNMLLHTKKEGVRVVLNVEVGLVVLGDEVRWAQLLVNMLSNRYRDSRHTTARTLLTSRSTSS
jgi:signal transduction histidine kinase